MRTAIDLRYCLIAFTCWLKTSRWHLKYASSLLFVKVIYEPHQVCIRFHIQSRDAISVYVCRLSITTIISYHHSPLPSTNLQASTHSPLFWSPPPTSIIFLTRASYTLLPSEDDWRRAVVSKLDSPLLGEDVRYPISLSVMKNLPTLMSLRCNVVRKHFNRLYFLVISFT